MVLASCAGITVGISTTIFLKILEAGIKFASAYRYYFIVMPVAFVLSVLFVKYLAPEAEGHGTEKVIEAVHRHSGKINPLVVPVKLIATVITIVRFLSAKKQQERTLQSREIQEANVELI